MFFVDLFFLVLKRERCAFIRAEISVAVFYREAPIGMAIGKIQERQRVKYKLQERLIDGDESATFLSVRTIQGHVRIHTRLQGPGCR